MKIIVLNSDKVGLDVSYEKLNELGDVVYYKKTKPEEIKERIRMADIIISTIDTPITRDIIESSKNLKMISVLATGLDSVDVEAANNANIVVKKVSDYATNSVAQHTLAMIMYVYNKVHEYNRYVYDGKWVANTEFDKFGIKWDGLCGKTIGVIGFGLIGQKVATIAKSFDCNIVYFSVSGKSKHDIIKRVSLHELLKISDIVTIHAPLNENTQNLITYKELKLMKKESILLNLGRGGIINENDLALALDANIIGFACLDVLRNEPPDYSNPLFQIKNKDKLVITPHIAWASNESRQLLVDKVIDNISCFLHNIKNKYDNEV